MAGRRTRGAVAPRMDRKWLAVAGSTSNIANSVQQSAELIAQMATGVGSVTVARIVGTVRMQPQVAAPDIIASWGIVAVPEIGGAALAPNPFATADLEEKYWLHWRHSGTFFTVTGLNAADAYAKSDFYQGHVDIKVKRKLGDLNLVLMMNCSTSTAEQWMFDFNLRMLVLYN